MIGAPEFAKKVGASESTVCKWCREGKIPGAEQDGYGKPWRIPEDAVAPKRKNAKS